jgi:hypothetical protein
MTHTAKELEAMGIAPARIACRRWRRERGLSVVSMAYMIGIHKDTLHRYETAYAGKEGYALAPEHGAAAEAIVAFMERWERVPAAREELERRVHHDRLLRRVAAQARMKARLEP